MSNIIGLVKRIFFKKKRKHTRFHVSNKSIVVITPTNEEGVDYQVNVIDVGMGGMAFVYEGSPEELQKAGYLKLFNNSAKESKIRFQTVSDIKTEDSQYRKRSVKFEWFGKLGERDLMKFIKEKGYMSKE